MKNANTFPLFQRTQKYFKFSLQKCVTFHCYKCLRVRAKVKVRVRAGDRARLAIWLGLEIGMIQFECYHWTNILFISKFVRCLPVSDLGMVWMCLCTGASANQRNVFLLVRVGGHMSGGDLWASTTTSTWVSPVLVLNFIFNTRVTSPSHVEV